MKALRIAAIALAVSAGGLAMAGTLKVALADHTDAMVKSVVDQSFGAVERLPAATIELRNALSRGRADRQVMAPDVRPLRSITVEHRVGESTSILTRISTPELAQR